MFKVRRCTITEHTCRLPVEPSNIMSVNKTITRYSSIFDIFANFYEIFGKFIKFDRDQNNYYIPSQT